MLVILLYPKLIKIVLKSTSLSFGAYSFQKGYTETILFSPNLMKLTQIESREVLKFYRGQQFGQFWCAKISFFIKFKPISKYLGVSSLRLDSILFHYPFVNLYLSTFYLAYLLSSTLPGCFRVRRATKVISNFFCLVIFLIPSADSRCYIVWYIIGLYLFNYFWQ